MKKDDVVKEILDIEMELSKLTDPIPSFVPVEIVKRIFLLRVRKDDYIDRLTKLIKKLDNGQLLFIGKRCEHVCLIVDIVPYFTEAFIDFKRLFEEPDYALDAYHENNLQHDVIFEMSYSQEYYNSVLDKSKIKLYEDYILSIMPNKDLHKLAKSAPSFDKAMYFYQYLKGNDQGFIQIDNKYYVIKVKYLKDKDKREYYYITNMLSLKKGDKVLVQAYNDSVNDIKDAKIIETNFYLESDLPVTLDDTLMVLIDSISFSQILYLKDSKISLSQVMTQSSVENVV